MMQITKNRLLLLIVMLLMSGCSTFGGGTEQAVEAKHYYVLDVDRGIRANPQVTKRVLRLEPVILTSQFRGKKILFKVGDNEYQAQEDHQFLLPPQAMFTEQVKRWLEKTGIFTEITTDVNKPADMVMKTAVTAFYGDAREGFTPQSVLEMQFFLLSAAAENKGQVIFQTGLRIDLDVEKITPANVVNGWKKSLKKILSTIESDLSDYFSE